MEIIICEGCGTDKDFLGGPIVLKSIYKGKGHFWCSWGCKNEYQRESEQNKEEVGGEQDETTKNGCTTNESNTGQDQIQQENKT